MNLSAFDLCVDSSSVQLCAPHHLTSLLDCFHLTLKQSLALKHSLALKQSETIGNNRKQSLITPQGHFQRCYQLSRQRALNSLDTAVLPSILTRAKHHAVRQAENRFCNLASPCYCNCRVDWRLELLRARTFLLSRLY
jgi:hypothetical protein